MAIVSSARSCHRPVGRSPRGRVTEGGDTSLKLVDRRPRETLIEKVFPKGKVFGCQPGERRPRARKRVLLANLSPGAIEAITLMDATGHYRGKVEMLQVYANHRQDGLGRVESYAGLLRTMDYLDGLKVLAQEESELAEGPIQFAALSQDARDTFRVITT